MRPGHETARGAASLRAPRKSASAFRTHSRVAFFIQDLAFWSRSPCETTPPLRAEPRLQGERRLLHGRSRSATAPIQMGEPRGASPQCPRKTAALVLHRQVRSATSTRQLQVAEGDRSKTPTTCPNPRSWRRTHRGAARAVEELNAVWRCWRMATKDRMPSPSWRLRLWTRAAGKPRVRFATRQGQ